MCECELVTGCIPGAIKTRAVSLIPYGVPLLFGASATHARNGGGMVGEYDPGAEHEPFDVRLRFNTGGKKDGERFSS